MTRRLVVRPEADRDIDAAADYLAESSLDAALRFLAATGETFDQLLQMPMMGSLQELRNPRLQGVRRWQVRGFPAYLIFYRVAEESLEVLRVLHDSRDVHAILEGTEPDKDGS